MNMKINFNKIESRDGLILTLAEYFELKKVYENLDELILIKEHHRYDHAYYEYHTLIEKNKKDEIINDIIKKQNKTIDGLKSIGIEIGQENKKLKEKFLEIKNMTVKKFKKFKKEDLK